MSILGIVLAIGGTFGSGAAACDRDVLRAGLEHRLEADAAARTVHINDRGSRAKEAAVVRLDAEHRQWLRPVLEQCGWPTEDVVGPKAARGAWLIAQHADMDPEFQEFAASKLREAVDAGRAPGRSLALLVDRNRRMRKLPQVYGLQFESHAGVTRFLPIEAPDALDARRAKIGLEPFACWYRSLRARGHLQLEWPEGVPRVECGNAL